MLTFDRFRAPNSLLAGILGVQNMPLVLVLVIWVLGVLVAKR